MPRILTALVYCLLSGSLIAQDFFLRYYDNGGDERARYCTVANGRIVLAGTTNARATDRLVGLTLGLDLNGNEVFATRMESDHRTFLAGVQPTGTEPTSGWLVAGEQNNQGTIDDISFYHLGPGGTPRGTFGWGLPTEDEEIRSFFRLENGDYLALGNIGTSDWATVRRLGPGGELRWYQRWNIPNTRFNVFQDMAEVNGELYLTGYSTEDASRGETMLVKFSAAGELQWSRIYAYPRQTDEGTRSMLAMPDGELFLLTRIIGDDRFTDALLLRVSATGDVLGRSILSGAGDLIINDLERMPSGNLLLAGALSITENGLQALVVELSPEGELQRQRTVGNARLSILLDAEPGPNGGFYLAGFGNFCDDLGEEDADILLAYLDDNLQNDLETCPPPALELESLPAAEVSVRSLGTVMAGSEPAVTPDVPVPTTLSRADLNCPVLDADADDSSAPETINGFRQAVVCYPGPLPIVDQDAAFNFRNPPARRIVLTLAGGEEEEFLAVAANLASLVVGNRSRQLTIDVNRLPDSLSVLRVLQRVNYHAEQPQAPSGRRSITGRVEYGCGFFSRFQTDIFMENLRLQTPVFLDTSLCEVPSIELNASDAAATNFQWGDGAQDAKRRVEEPGTYTLLRTGPCGEERDTFLVRAGLPAPAPIPVPRQSLCPEDSLTVDLSSPNTGVYRWDDGFTGPRRTLLPGARHQVVLANACASDSLEISLLAVSCCEVYLPNAFSPNGDGLNDRFRPLPSVTNCGLLSDWSLTVYNRWGGLVYQTTDAATGWDGRANGRPAPVGNYAYLLTYFDGLGPQRTAGSVQLLR